MHELRNRAERLCATGPLAIGTLALVPIERTAVEWAGFGSGAWFAANKEFHALVVQRSGRTEALGAAGAALRLDSLCERVPGLDALLARLCAG